MPGTADPEHTDDSLWFTQDAEKAAKTAFQLALSADTDNAGRRGRATYNASILDGVGLAGFGAWGYGRGSQPSWGSIVGVGNGRTGQGCPLIWNYAAAGLDTAQAKIVGQDEPKPFIEVTDGDYDDHRQSVWSGRLLDGVYRQDQGMYHDVWDLARAAWKLAAGCTGTTAIKAKPHPGESKMVFELHDTLDMFIDFFECTYSMPMTYGESTWFDPLRLMACVDDQKTKQLIWDSREPLPREFGGETLASPKYMVRLVEAWRLQMNKGEPGKYLQAVKQGPISLDDYPHSSPPFAFLHARRSLCGFYGLPLMERGMRIVERINTILAGLDKSETLTPRNMLIYDIEASPAGLLQNMRDIMLAGYSSKTNPNAKAPQYITPTIYDETVVALLEMHIRAFHETLGINSNEMGATKPQGVVAAVAVRAVADLFTQLFAILSRDYIKCVTTQLGTLTLRSLGDMKKDGKSLKVSWNGGKFMRTVNSDMIDLGEKQFTCSVEPTGGARGTPADRMSLADEMLARKQISEAGYQRILQTGDVPAETRTQQRQTSMIAKAIDQWMNDDEDTIKPISPLPWMNLPEAITQVLDGYMEALMLEGFPIERELYFRRYITLCDQMLQRQTTAKAQLSGVAKNFKGPAPADSSGAAPAPEAPAA